MTSWTASSVVRWSVMLDIGRAFDEVNHKALVYKLAEMFKISPFPSYLSDRIFHTRVDSDPSSILTVRTEVPQSSKLSLFLYDMYVTDMPRLPPTGIWHRCCICRWHCVFCHCLFFGISSGPPQDYLTRVVHFLRFWGLWLTTSDRDPLVVKETASSSASRYIRDSYPLVFFLNLSCLRLPFHLCSSWKIRTMASYCPVVSLPSVRSGLMYGCPLLRSEQFLESL